MAALILGIAFVLIIYFIPSAVAEKKEKFGAIFALNLFLGWTFIGWVVALVWALADKEKSGNHSTTMAQSRPLNQFCPKCGRDFDSSWNKCITCDSPLLLKK